MVRHLSALWIAALLSPAWAQDAPTSPDEAPLEGPDAVPLGEEGVEEPEVEPEPVDEPALSYQGKDWRWLQVGPRDAGALSDVGMANKAEWLVVGLDGGAWLSVDAGATWTPTLANLGQELAPESSEEGVLLGVESRLEELFGDLNTDDIEFDDEGALEDLLDQANSVGQDAAEEVRADLGSDPWFLEQEDVLSGRRDSARPRVWRERDQWWVGRADGLWRSSDGRSWEQVLTEPTTALTRTPDASLLLAGTADGMRFSVDGVAWIDADDGTEGVRFLDLQWTPYGVFGAAQGGLWFSEDGQVWRRRSAIDEDVLAVFADPSRPERVWLSVNRTLLVSRDGGQSFREPFSAPLPGVVELLWLSETHLMLVSSDGPWESLDSGFGWLPVNQGLSSPDTRGIAQDGAVILMAGSEGLLSLVPGLTDEELQARRDASEQDIRNYPMVGSLIDSSLNRAELRRHIPTGARWKATMTPQLVLEYWNSPYNRLYYTPLSGTRIRDARDWQVMTRLVWTPEGRSRSTVDTGEFAVADGSIDLDIQDQVSVIVQDNEAVILDDRNLVASSATVSRGTVQYASRLSAELRDLYSQRIQLMRALPDVERRTLREQVEHQLHIQEIEARLDALSGGAVSLWRAGQTP